MATQTQMAPIGAFTGFTTMNDVRTVQTDSLRIPLVGHIITDDDIGALKGTRLQAVNLGKVIKLLTDEHSVMLFDRHLHALKKVCKHYKDGFVMKDLVPIFKTLNICADRIDQHPVYIEPMVNILKICCLPFLKEKSSDELAYEQIAVESIAQLGYLMRVPSEEVRLQICDTLIKFYCEAPPPQIVQKHMANSLEYNQKIVEKSDLAETLVKSLALLENDVTIKIAVLNVLQRLSKFSVGNCNMMLQADGAERMCSRLMDYDPSGQVLFRSVDILWNLLENSDSQEVARQLNHYSCVSQLRDAFIHQLTQGYSHYDRQLRNDLLVIASMTAQTCVQAPFVETNFARQLVLFATFQEVKSHNALVKHLKLMTNHEDFELKKLFINMLVLLCADPGVIPILSEGKLLLALFSYVKANEKTSNPQEWTVAQFEEIQLHAMSALCTLGPLMIEDYMTCQGSTRLLLLLEWCVGPDDYLGTGNSFHGAGGRDNKKAQMRHCLRLIRSMVSTGEEQVLQDFTDQGAINQIISILTKITENRKPIENVVDIEMQGDMLLILSALCENDVHRKELFGAQGVDVVVEYLKTDIKQLTSGLGHHRLLLAAVDSVWCCVVGCYTTEDYFLEKEGVFQLIDLIENCPKNMHNLTLGCLLDLCENPKTIAHVNGWRGTDNISAAHLLCDLWRSEEADIGVCREQTGAMADTKKPLMGEYQIYSGTICLPASNPSQAIVDVSENMRAKIYAIFCKIGFIDLPGLDTDDHVTLTIIEHYLDFKLGEVWSEVAQELQVEDIRPITPDREALEAISRTIDDRAEHVSQVQRELLDAQHQQDLINEQEYYSEIRENHRQKEKTLKDFSEYVARTSNYTLLKAAKERQELSIDASRVATNYKQSESFHGTDLPNLNATDHLDDQESCDHIDLEEFLVNINDEYTAESLTGLVSPCTASKESVAETSREDTASSPATEMAYKDSWYDNIREKYSFLNIVIPSFASTVRGGALSPAHSRFKGHHHAYSRPRRPTLCTANSDFYGADEFFHTCDIASYSEFVAPYKRYHSKISKLDVDKIEDEEEIPIDRHINISIPKVTVEDSKESVAKIENQFEYFPKTKEYDIMVNQSSSEGTLSKDDESEYYYPENTNSNPTFTPTANRKNCERSTGIEEQNRVDSVASSSSLNSLDTSDMCHHTSSQSVPITISYDLLDDTEDQVYDERNISTNNNNTNDNKDDGNKNQENVISGSLFNTEGSPGQDITASSLFNDISNENWQSSSFSGNNTILKNDTLHEYLEMNICEKGWEVKPEIVLQKQQVKCNIESDKDNDSMLDNIEEDVDKTGGNGNSHQQNEAVGNESLFADEMSVDVSEQSIIQEVSMANRDNDFSINNTLDENEAPSVETENNEELVQNLASTWQVRDDDRRVIRVHQPVSDIGASGDATHQQLRNTMIFDQQQQQPTQNMTVGRISNNTVSVSNRQVNIQVTNIQGNVFNISIQPLPSSVFDEEEADEESIAADERRFLREHRHFFPRAMIGSDSSSSSENDSQGGYDENDTRENENKEISSENETDGKENQEVASENEAQERDNQNQDTFIENESDENKKLENSSKADVGNIFDGSSMEIDFKCSYDHFVPVTHSEAENDLHFDNNNSNDLTCFSSDALLGAKVGKSDENSSFQINSNNENDDKDGTVKNIHKSHVIETGLDTLIENKSCLSNLANVNNTVINLSETELLEDSVNVSDSETSLENHSCFVEDTVTCIPENHKISHNDYENTTDVCCSEILDNVSDINNNETVDLEQFQMGVNICSSSSCEAGDEMSTMSNLDGSFIDRYHEYDEIQPIPNKNKPLIYYKEGAILDRRSKNELENHQNEIIKSISEQTVQDEGLSESLQNPLISIQAPHQSLCDVRNFGSEDSIEGDEQYNADVEDAWEDEHTEISPSLACYKPRISQFTSHYNLQEVNSDEEHSAEEDYEYTFIEKQTGIKELRLQKEALEDNMVKRRESYKNWKNKFCVTAHSYRKLQAQKLQATEMRKLMVQDHADFYDMDIGTDDQYEDKPKKQVHFVNSTSVKAKAVSKKKTSKTSKQFMLSGKCMFSEHNQDTAHVPTSVYLKSDPRNEFTCQDLLNSSYYQSGANSTSKSDIIYAKNHNSRKTREETMGASKIDNALLSTNNNNNIVDLKIDDKTIKDQQPLKTEISIKHLNIENDHRYQNINNSAQDPMEFHTCLGECSNISNEPIVNDQNTGLGKKDNASEKGGDEFVIPVSVSIKTNIRVSHSDSSAVEHVLELIDDEGSYYSEMENSDGDEELGSLATDNRPLYRSMGQCHININ